ncbi:MAG: transcriptional repressor [Deltaproteobacteria bacterium]|nr:MAG: transcriptional repressor [Deltaproteobacteria bacterium]
MEFRSHLLESPRPAPMTRLERRIQKLRENRLRLTPQRLSILKILEGDTSHPTSEDIYRRAKKIHPSISRSTVYRTLETLVRAGEITEIRNRRTSARFETNDRPHQHIVCEGCGRMEDIELSPSWIEACVPAEVRQRYEISPTGLVVYGFCGACRGETGERDGSVRSEDVASGRSRRGSAWERVSLAGKEPQEEPGSDDRVRFGGANGSEIVEDT